MADNGSKKPTRDVDDISLDDARPARKSGKGGVALILILLIIGIALIWYISTEQKKKAAEAAQAKRDAAISRQAQLDAATKNLQLAADKAAAGDIGGALDKLEVADAMLGNIVSAANSEGDTEAASQVLTQKKAVSDAVAALKAKQQDLQAVADEQFGILRSQFGLTAPTPASEAPATTPEDTTAPAPPPAEGMAPATPPAEGTAPAAPPATAPPTTAPPAAAPPAS